MLYANELVNCSSWGFPLMGKAAEPDVWLRLRRRAATLDPPLPSPPPPPPLGPPRPCPDLSQQLLTALLLPVFPLPSVLQCLVRVILLEHRSEALLPPVILHCSQNQVLQAGAGHSRVAPNLARPSPSDPLSQPAPPYTSFTEWPGNAELTVPFRACPEHHPPHAHLGSSPRWPVEPSSLVPLSVHSVPDPPSQTLRNGWPASACSVLVPGSSLPLEAVLGTCGESEPRAGCSTLGLIPPHQPLCSARRKPDAFPWPAPESNKDRLHNVLTLALPHSHLLTSQLPELIPLVLGVKSLCLLSLLPKDRECPQTSWFLLC